MLVYLFVPRTIGGALRRLSILALLFCAICARNKWLLSDGYEPSAFPDVSSSTAKILALSHEMASWPYIIGFFITGVLLELAAWYVDMLEFSVEDPDESADQPTVH